MAFDPDYYEVLGVEPHLAAADIQVAIDEKHAHWRRLINHHERSKRRQAETQLELLQEIRETLMNADRRTAYDAQLSRSQNSLIDPHAARDKHPVRVRGASLDSSNENRYSIHANDIWRCHQCGLDNLAQTLWCTRCGERVGAPCPGCRKPIYVRIEFCPHCGVEVRAVARASLEKTRVRKLEQLNDERARIQQEIATLLQLSNRRIVFHDKRTHQYVSISVFGVIQWLVGAVFVSIGVLTFPDLFETQSLVLQAGSLVLFWVLCVGIALSLYNHYAVWRIKHLTVEHIPALREEVASLTAEIRRVQGSPVTTLFK